MPLRYGGVTAELSEAKLAMILGIASIGVAVFAGVFGVIPAVLAIYFSRRARAAIAEGRAGPETATAAMTGWWCAISAVIISFIVLLLYLLMGSLFLAGFGAMRGMAFWISQ